MELSVVASAGPARRLLSGHEPEEFEQELVDQYALAYAAAGAATPTSPSSGRRCSRSSGSSGDRCGPRSRRTWTGSWVTNAARGWPGAPCTRAGHLARFFDFLLTRYQAQIHAATDHVLVQPVDEFNRPRKADYGGTIRVPPSEAEVETLFAGWREALPSARKFLPAARDYLAASLWRRVGLRIGETLSLDIRDWRPDLGEHGKLHVRFGKGSMGRGPKTRLVPAINSVDALLTWWLSDIRHQFGDDWDDPDAPLLPSDAATGPSAVARGSETTRCGRGSPRRSAGGCRPGRGS